MKNNHYVRLVVTISLLAFFIVSVVIPMAPAYNFRTSDKKIIIVDDYDCYHRSEVSSKEQYIACRERVS